MSSAVRQNRHEFKTQLWCLVGKALLENYLSEPLLNGGNCNNYPKE